MKRVTITFETDAKNAKVIKENFYNYWFGEKGHYIGNLEIGGLVIQNQKYTASDVRIARIKEKWSQFIRWIFNKN